MEKRLFSSLLILSTVLLLSVSLSPLRYNCPTSTGTLVSDRIQVSSIGDIVITNQQSYCYTLTLPKRFSRSPNVAVALNKFTANSTNNLYLAVKPLANINNRSLENSQSLTTISFSVNLYQMYTRWTLIEFYFLAEDRLDVEAGYMIVDAGVLGRCDAGKSINTFLPFKTQMSSQLEAFVFLNGFQISAKSSSALEKFSPLEVQLLNKRVNSNGISITVSVTSATQVYSLLVSYVAFQQKPGKIYGGSYTFQNYDQFPTQDPRSVSHSPQVLIDQLWARINGLTGLIINSNSNELSFDAGDFTSVYNIKINNFWKYFSYEYVFLMGGLCSDCDGFNIYHLGQCIKDCPAQTIFNGYTCIQCAQSQVWNGTHCINRCNSGRVFLNGNCVCPDNTQWNSFGCIPCTGGKIWNPLSRNCPCPVNAIWNGNLCITCNGGRTYDSVTRECICSLGSNWNGLTCTRTCPSPQFWNTTIQQCQCQFNLVWNGSTCVPCTGGRQYDSLTRKCECQTGTWNGFSCISTATCQGGMIWNSLLRICQCPKMSYLLNGGCIACGSLPEDSTRRQCRCSNPNTFWNGFDCIVCDRQRVFDPFVGTCNCAQGQWNGFDCVSSVCPKGFQQFGKSCFCPLNMNEINGQCVAPTSCSSGMMWSNVLKKCEPIQCQQGTYWDGEKCVSSAVDPKNNCPFSTYWNGFFCASFSENCPTGTEWTGDFCQTVEKRCQPGMYWTGSTCAFIPSQCPVQLVWNDQQNRCVPSNNVCPSGTYFNGFSCMPYSGCKNGQIWSNSLVQCVCPENSFWNSVNCVPCVGGMFFGPSGCYCPLGTFFNGTACSRIASNECSSIPFSFLNGQTCDCLPGFDKIDSLCVCRGVMIGINQCDKCTLKPNSKWSGFACQCNLEYIEVLGQCKLKSQTNNPTGVVPTDGPIGSCTVGTYFDRFEQKCLLCSDGCLSCRDCYQCQQCRPQYTFLAASRSCIEICGDGKRFSLQCDDGNNVNGDGCSSDCRIEPEYTCMNGSPNSKDTCSKFKPEKVELVQTGQTRLFGKILMNVKLNYLPTNLTHNVKECDQSCDRILLVKLIDGQRTYLSINSKYIKGSSYSFSIEIDFGREPISQFTAQVSINKEIQEKYFSGIDIGNSISVKINPAYLARVDKKNERID